jgi:hypothetical protein
VTAVIVNVVDADGGGVMLTTLAARPPEHSLPAVGVTPVGHKNACAGNALFGAFQNPVPSMVTNVLPVIEPATVPVRPVTEGAPGEYVKVGTKDGGEV